MFIKLQTNRQLPGMCLVTPFFCFSNVTLIHLWSQPAIEGITDYHIASLAASVGIDGVSTLIFGELRDILRKHLEKLMFAVIAITMHCR